MVRSVILEDSILWISTWLLPSVQGRHKQIIMGGGGGGKAV